jgi:dephospho-CoA kinase
MSSDSQRPRSERLIIGIAGRIGSGKTTVGRYLESGYGFQYLRYSAVLADWFAQDPDSKDHLQRVGWEVMAGGMQADLNRRLVMQIQRKSNVAVDGLRHPLDYETLYTTFSSYFRLLFIDSSAQLRFERLSAKGKYSDFTSFNSADSHPVEQQIDAIRANASLVIANGASLQNLYSLIDDAVSRFQKEG